MAESEFLLLRRFVLNGDSEAFSEIVKQHAPLVYGVCLRILGNKENAADAVQDTFLQLVHDAEEITGSLSNWLHRVATCRAIDLVRSDSQRKKRELNYAANSEFINSEDEKAAWQEISVFIDEELENLDDQTREVIILRFFENLTTNDIAEKCGISQQTVSRRIEAGIELLRQKLKSRGIVVSAALFITLLSENIIQAAPAFIMKELGKIAIAGIKVSIGPKIMKGISAFKVKILASTVLMIILIGSSVMYFSFNRPEEQTGVLRAGTFDADSFQLLNEEEKIAFVQRVLEEREAQLQNFEYDVNMKIRNIYNNGEKTDYFRDLTWNIKRKSEKLFYEIEIKNSKGHMMNYKATWDGSIGKTLLYDPDRKYNYDGIVTDSEDSNFTERAFNHILGLRLLDTGKKNLPEWFKVAQAKGQFIEIDMTNENGKLLIECTAIFGDWTYQFFLDINRDFMPIRAEILYQTGEKGENYNSDSSFVTEANEVDGFWIPIKVTRNTGTSIIDWVSEHTYVVSKFVRNKVKDEDFIINYPPGTRIGDRIKNVMYKVLPDGGTEQIPFYDSNSGKVVLPQDLENKIKSFEQQ